MNYINFNQLSNDEMVKEYRTMQLIKIINYCKNKDYNKIKTFIIKYDILDEYFTTPLLNILITYKCSLEVIKFVIENKNINIEKKDANGMTALIRACDKHNINVMKYLIEEKHANVDAQDNNGETCVFHIFGNEDVENTKYLIDKGVNLNLKDKWGCNILTHVCYSDISSSYEVMEYLIQVKNADINTKDDRDRSTFVLTCLDGSLDCVKFLLNNCNVDINSVYEDTRTLLTDDRVPSDIKLLLQ